ncbi:MAG: AraC-like DNA-binding protein/mannose-6-phosphate isomerase-like protein (cupin superfamily) [Gammaproteobacteria bacterium]|jgi:AraC-like DNA-binding protein/mannose-6-phosphate isomerase-like protein (cupin superfamily)
MPNLSQSVAELNQELGHLEALPQPVVAYGRDLGDGEILPFHQHRRAQLVYASSGVMTVTTPFAAYVVPPQRAVWMPGGVSHRIDARGNVTMRTLYIEATETARLPEQVCVLQVSPLLRELIVTVVASGPSYEPNTAQSRMMSVVLDQICAQPVASLSLPLPTDSRPLRVANALIDNPADPRDLRRWAKDVGASTRTLSRLFTAQTGMTFRAWRQQRRLLRALELLASGNNVTTVALELGYDNTSAFIAMFRRCLGTTPARYLGTGPY